MLFSSITFLGFFLPFILIIYYVIPNRTYRNCVLFLGSLLFYAWGEPKFIFLMFASIIFNYNMGLRLGKLDFPHRKVVLSGCIFMKLKSISSFIFLNRWFCGINLSYKSVYWLKFNSCCDLSIKKTPPEYILLYSNGVCKFSL